MTRNKKRQIMLITILSLLICSFIMWKTLDKQNYSFFENNNSATNSSNNNYIVDTDKALKFIDDYNLRYLTTIKEEITNQDKLKMAFEYLTRQPNIDFNKGVNKAHFETYIHYVFGVDTEIENESIIYNNMTIIYDDSIEEYYYNEELEPINYEIALDKIKKFTINNNTYELTLASIYESDNKIYGSLNDYINKTNSLLEVKSLSNFEKKYYKKIEDQVQLCKYKLVLEGKHLVLKDYEIINQED